MVYVDAAAAGGTGEDDPPRVVNGRVERGGPSHDRPTTLGSGMGLRD
jgi:hypothetical protein